MSMDQNAGRMTARRGSHSLDYVARFSPACLPSVPMNFASLASQWLCVHGYLLLPREARWRYAPPQADEGLDPRSAISCQLLDFCKKLGMRSTCSQVATLLEFWMQGR